MTDSTTTSIGGFTVGDHVRLRDDADPKAYGRVRGVRFGDGVIDRLEGRWSTGVSIRVRDGVHDAGPRADDWYWYATDELELVHDEGIIDAVRTMGVDVERRLVLDQAGIWDYDDADVAFRDALCTAMGVTPDDEGLLGAFARFAFDELGPVGFCGDQWIRVRDDSPFAAMCRALLEAYDRLPHDADGKVLHVGDRVMLAPGVEGDCDAHHWMFDGDVLCVSDVDFRGRGKVALGDAAERFGYYLQPEELVHAPADDAPDADETDAPEAKPEPASDVPHGLAGLRKLSMDIYGNKSLWCAIRAENDDEWGVGSDDPKNLSETIARLADEIGAEQAAGRGGSSMPEGCYWPTYADGTPVRIGDEVYDQPGGFTTEVARVAIRDDQWYLLDSDGYDISWGGRGDHPRRYVAPTPDLKPEDTWDQLREDATVPPASYCDRHDVNLDQGWEPSDAARAMALDLVRRAKALAGDAS